jgi:phospholipid/cholesterol/gamma-HCH transport system substrate-binding protein
MIPKKWVYSFVLVGVGFFALVVLGAGYRQGWFSPHETFRVRFDSGDGLFAGTPVSIAGLKAGQVSKVELDETNRVHVEIRIQSKFAKRIYSDAKAQLGRPFIIGERMITVVPGTPGKPQLTPGSEMEGEQLLEITDMLSGGRLAPYFDTFTKLLDQVKVVIEGDGTAQAVPLAELYKQAYKTLRSIELAGRDLSAIKTDFALSADMRKVMANMAKSSDSFPSLFANADKALPQFGRLSGEMSTLMPELSKAMGDMSFTLQAMQRSFILSGGVKELKREQEKQREEDAKKRVPAASDSAQD